MDPAKHRLNDDSLKRLGVVLESVAVTNWGGITVAGAPYTPQLMDVPKSSVCDIAINPRVLGGPIVQPKQEERNCDDKSH